MIQIKDIKEDIADERNRHQPTSLTLPFISIIHNIHFISSLRLWLYFHIIVHIIHHILQVFSFPKKKKKKKKTEKGLVIF